MVHNTPKLKTDAVGIIRTRQSTQQQVNDNIRMRYEIRPIINV